MNTTELEQFSNWNPEKLRRFDRWNEEGIALTYGELTAQTEASDYYPHEVDISSMLSMRIPLKVPFISAAMDRVTEAPMAIAMAEEGGIGMIHQSLPHLEQKHVARDVKNALRGFIDNPVTYQHTLSMGDILNDLEDNPKPFRTFPIVDGTGKFVGLITQTEFDFCRDTSLPVREIMTKVEETITTEVLVDPAEALKIMDSQQKKTLPILNPDGTIRGIYTHGDVKEIVMGNRDRYNLDDKDQLRVIIAANTRDVLARLAMMEHYIDGVYIDTSTGDGKAGRKAVAEALASFPNIDIITGNITSARSAVLFAKLGAHAITVGQGPGSICTTRDVTGYGTPQGTAIFNIKKALVAEGYPDLPVIADGGVAKPGHASIAIACGASSVKMGSMLSGTDQSPGEIIDLPDGSRVKEYRGMGSLGAYRDSDNAMLRYEEDPDDEPIAQGVEGLVPYRGSVRRIVRIYAKSLRLSLSGIGARDLGAHQRDTVLWRQTAVGAAEGTVHSLSSYKSTRQY